MSERPFDEIPAALRKGWERTEAADAWVELLGARVPEDVRRLPLPSEGGFLLKAPGELLSASNTFEAALERNASGNGFTPLLQVFTNVYFLSSVEGDCLMHHSPADSETAEVVAWDHETGGFREPCAWDLPTVMALLAAAGSDASVEKRAALLRPALGRFDDDAFPLSLLRKDLERDGVWKAAQPKKKPRFEAPQSMFEGIVADASWIIAALTSRTPDRELIKDALQYELPDELVDYPPYLLYWLFRSFLLGEDTPLETVLEQAKESESRLVRDAADYLERERTRSLAPVREAVMKLVDEMGFPARVEAGPVTLLRDDALASVERPAAERMKLAEAEGAQPMNAWWREDPLAFPHPDGRHVMVFGHHDHPRRGRHGSIPDCQDALIEVDRETGAGRVFCTMEGDHLTAGAYFGADRILALGANQLHLFERHAGRGVLVESLGRTPNRALFLPDRGEVVLYQSRREADHLNPPESVEVVRVDGGSLRRIAKAGVALGLVAFRDGELVGADEAGKVGYRIEIAREPSSGVVFRPSAFVEEELEPVTGPRAILEALDGFCACSYQSASGRCLVLKCEEGNYEDFKVFVGDDDGIREAQPSLISHNEWFDFIDPEHALVYSEGAVHSVDLRGGRIEKLFDTDVAEVRILREGFAVVRDGALVVLNRSGREVRRLALGEGGEMIGSLFEGRAVAVKAEATPLAIVAVRGDQLELVGAVRPENPDLESASFEVLHRPLGYRRLFARVNDRLYQPFGLAAAIDQSGRGATLADALPSEPWEAAPELTAEVPEPGAE